MTPLAQTLLATFAALTLGMGVLWLASVRLRDASIIDPAWGAGFIVVAGIAMAINSPAPWRVGLLAGLVSLWGARLSLYLLWRNRGHGEDRRYASMRHHHGDRFWWVSLFTVFLLQAALLWFISLPIQFAAVKQCPVALGALDAAGVLLWLTGILFETIGDWQLARFKADPSNARRVLDRGLWRWTRHPNYFGDFCVWWGIYLVAAAGGAAGTVASPIVMSVLLMKISGVALLESDIKERRPEYDEYKQRTNAFFPGPRKQR